MIKEFNFTGFPTQEGFETDSLGRGINTFPVLVKTGTYPGNEKVSYFLPGSVRVEVNGEVWEIEEEDYIDSPSWIPHHYYVRYVKK